MVSYKEFEQEFQEALRHLHDPDYQPCEALCAAIGCDFGDGIPAVRATILRAIESLEPSPDTPPSAPTRQVYGLLYNRFVLRLTQEETAYRLNVSRRTVNRLQHKAVQALAGALWRHSQTIERVTRDLHQGGDALPAERNASGDQIPDWRSQMQRELDSLRAKAPNVVCDVGEAISNVLEFIDPLAPKLGVRVEVRSVQPGLVAAVHPVLLRQVLISALKRFAPYVSNEQVVVYARLEDGNVKITLTGGTSVGSGLNEMDFTSGIPISEDMSIKVCIDGTQAFVWINAPSIGKVTVLVVDDNEDMARFYRDCTIGTRYHIVHIAQGGNLFETVEVIAPDLIVLDVMLPDIDGWRLLMRLHEDPTTRSIPVVICSVVQEEDLALSLGAARYLSKPVRAREFIQAMDQVLPQVPAATLISPVSSA